MFVLVMFTNLTILDGMICMAFVLIFSFAQIIIATKLDLNHTKFSKTQAETEMSNGKTITKVVFIGLILALLTGIVSVITYIFSQGALLSLIKSLQISEIYVYIIPFIVSLLYFMFSIIYLNKNIDKSFNKLNS